MPAKRHDIIFEQGSKFELTVQVKNPDGTIMDLSGYQGRMQVRPSVDSATILVSATTGTSEIAINGPLGIVQVSIGSDVTTAYTWDFGVYDLEIYTKTTNVISIAKGFAAVHKEVTR